jgi:alpha-beta hydrolase superfamily lysophospholipase
MTLAASPLAVAENGTTPTTGHAKVDGLNLYYEVHGAGEPLILLHGGLGATEMFAAVLPLLSKTRRVIAVDLQGHGRTAGVDRPLSFDALTDDVAALMKHLGIGKADVMGYSLGGGVALRDVSALCANRAEAGRLADAAHQGRRAGQEGV